MVRHDARPWPCGGTGTPQRDAASQRSGDVARRRRGEGVLTDGGKVGWRAQRPSGLPAWKARRRPGLEGESCPGRIGCGEPSGCGRKHRRSEEDAESAPMKRRASIDVHSRDQVVAHAARVQGERAVDCPADQSAGNDAIPMRTLGHGVPQAGVRAGLGAFVEPDDNDSTISISSPSSVVEDGTIGHAGRASCNTPRVGVESRPATADTVRVRTPAMATLLVRTYSSRTVAALVVCFYALGAARAIIPGLCATQREAASCCVRAPSPSCSREAAAANSRSGQQLRAPGTPCAFCFLIGALAPPPLQLHAPVPSTRVIAGVAPTLPQFFSLSPWRTRLGRAPPSSMHTESVYF